MRDMGGIKLSHAGRAEFSHQETGGAWGIWGPPRDKEKLGQRQGGSLLPGERAQRYLGGLLGC